MIGPAVARIGMIDQYHVVALRRTPVSVEISAQKIKITVASLKASRTQRKAQAVPLSWRSRSASCSIAARVAASWPLGADWASGTDVAMAGNSGERSWDQC